jgi:hypothetical protein
MEDLQKSENTEKRKYHYEQQLNNFNSKDSEKLKQQEKQEKQNKLFEFHMADHKKSLIELKNTKKKSLITHVEQHELTDHDDLGYKEDYNPLNR